MPKAITASTKCPQCGSGNTAIMAGVSGMSSYRKRCKHCNHRWQVNGDSGNPMPVIQPLDSQPQPSPHTILENFYYNNATSSNELPSICGPTNLNNAPPPVTPEPPSEPDPERPHTFGKGERKLDL
jgi:hypothetical protein